MAFQNTTRYYQITKTLNGLTQDHLKLMETSKVVSTSGRPGPLIHSKTFQSVLERFNKEQL